MRADGELTDASLGELDAQVGAQIAAAVEAAEAAPLEPVEDLARFVHSEAREQEES
jgi:pyruvate dehydrogenase E1 component alpha subunit